MKKNMGSTDKIIRIILAVGLGVLYFTHVVTGGVGIALLVVAAIFLITSFISFCPLYSIFGLTSKKNNNNGTTRN
ncbi:MAG TPA: DUF2892 domain-containing protein [Chitinophagaceae bacterium]